MESPWIAGMTSLFLWWFSTGAILLAVRLADKAGGNAPRQTTLAGLPLLGFGLWAFHVSMSGTSAASTYGAFLSALAIWGWVELAFLTGVITGPNARDCPPDRPEWERFIRAWGTIAYHKMLLTALLILLWLHAHDAANTTGLWTFTTLYFARISASLNLFFGVPRINTEFLPRTLGHLASHFRISRLNWVFPVSVTTLTFATACWLERLYAATTTAEATGFALLASLTALALLEHWLMVLPLPDAKLWRWMLPAPNQTKNTTRPEEAHGL